MKDSKVSFNKFSELYLQNVKQVLQFLTDDLQAAIALHNYGWRDSDFKTYLELSVRRFYIAYKAVPSGVKSCCDIGGFWGVYPLVLKELGYEVAMTETLKYYDSKFDPLFVFLQNEKGLKIVDIDPFEENSVLHSKYDYISVMAVLEHIHSSLVPFLENMTNSLSPKGYLYIEVPNIAYARKRMDLFFGKSPNPHIQVINKSRVPFTGHHHEYAPYELKSLFNDNENLVLKDSYYYNYSMPVNIMKILRYPISNFMFLTNKNSKEVIACLGQKI